MFEKQYTPLKIVMYTLLGLVCYVCQSVAFPLFRFMGNAPELLLVLAICVAFNESETFAAFFGLFAGFLCDVLTDTIVGKSALFFMFAAFIISILLRTMLRNLFTTYITTVLCALVVFLLLEYAFQSLFFGGIPFASALVRIILPKFFFTGVWAYPLYFIVKFMGKKLWQGGDNV